MFITQAKPYSTRGAKGGLVAKGGCWNSTSSCGLRGVSGSTNTYSLGAARKVERKRFCRASSKFGFSFEPDFQYGKNGVGEPAEQARETEN